MHSVYRFGGLIGVILRRDRGYLPWWILGLVVFATLVVPLMPELLSNPQSSAALNQMMKNPAMIAMTGVSYGTSNGAMFALFMLVWTAVAIAVFNILFVVRHTRGNEELGRNEIIASLPVGRNAQLLAVLVVAFFANTLIAVLTAGIIPLFGVEDIGFEGALVYGEAIALGGFAFAAVAALFAQIFSSSKATLVWSFVFLGAAYLLRAYGDMNHASEFASLISPLGLIERVEAWVSNETWPLLLVLVESLFVAMIAFMLSSARSVGAGLIPTRRGRAHATPLLRGEWGLAWRLSRSIFLGWALVMFVLGACYGAVLNDIGDFMQSNLMFDTIIGAEASSDSSMLDSFISFMMLFMAVLAAVPVCMIITKLRREERRGRTEQVLAKSVGRVPYLGGYVLIAMLLAVVLLLCTPLGMYASALVVMKNPPELSMMILASLNYLPAVLLVMGLAVLCVGGAPKVTSIVWVFLAFCFMIAYVGNLMEAAVLDETLRTVVDVLLVVTPFNALPLWPIDESNLMVSLGICAGALVCVVLGAVLYRRRDLKG